MTTYLCSVQTVAKDFPKPKHLQAKVMVIANADVKNSLGVR